MEIDFETSVEQEEVRSNFPSITKGRFSIFDLTLDITSDSKNDKSTEYEEKLTNEMDEWHSLLKETNEKVHKVKLSEEKVDLSILNAEQIKYLEMAPNIQKFIDESVDFCKKAQKYLNKDHAELLEGQEQLTQLCKDQLGKVAISAIEEYIYNNKNI